VKITDAIHEFILYKQSLGMARRATTYTPEQLAELQAEMERAEHELENAKLPYFNSVPYKDEPVPYEKLKEYAEAFIRANHAVQKARFGRVHVRLDVSRLLRE
jgi:hypothetical protein